MVPEHSLTETAVPANSNWQKEYDRFEQLQFLRRFPTKNLSEYENLRPLMERYRELERAAKETPATIDWSMGNFCPLDCRLLVPHREISGRLVDLYMTTTESVLCILYIPSFLHDYIYIFIYNKLVCLRT